MKDIEKFYPLSPMQEGLLFHTVTAPGAGTYITRFSCRVRGTLDLSVFERVWQRVIERHPALRTFFLWEKLTRPVQLVARQARMPLADQDWRGLSQDVQQARLSRFLQTERETDFDLAQAPLMRLAVIRLDDQESQIIWSFHHLLLDGWCLALVVKEVFAFYEAFIRGEELHLPPGRPFSDYITWLQQQDLGVAEKFWRETLRGFTAPTPLVVDKPLAAVLSDAPEEYGEQQLRLSAEATDSLVSCARRHKLTVNTLIQGAWALLLSRYSGEDDVLFGAIVSGRPPDLKGVESMVGLFINTLPVRVRVPAASDLLSWLKKFQVDQVEARQYEYSPLLKVHGWSEVPRSSPLFQSILVFENYPFDQAATSGEASLQLVDARSFEQTNYPLSVMVTLDGELAVKIFYDLRRFDASAIARLLGHYGQLLEEIARDAGQKVGEISLLSAGERDEILYKWNQTAREYPEKRCLHELFAEQARVRSGHVAVRYGREELTYEELNQRSNRLAHYLRKCGVGTETMVGLMMSRSVEMVVSVLAILKAGGAYVPLDPSYPQERLEYMLGDAGVAVMITESQYAEMGLLQAAELAGSKVLRVDEESERIGAESSAEVSSQVVPGNLAYVIYTSGSTGRPKGTLIQHEGLSNLGQAQRLAFEEPPDGCVLQFSSLSFDASIFEIAMAFGAGATLCLATPEALALGAPLAQFLRQQAVTNVTLPPSVLSVLPVEELPALRTIIVAGEACPADLVERWAPGRQFFNAYGPTESTVWATIARCSGGADKPSIGKPIRNLEVYVLDGEMGLVPVGVPGELHLGGVGLARGYLHRPELTAERFIPHPYSQAGGARLYRTGDLGRYLPDGEIEFLGRLDHQVKMRGYRIELGEIEAVLAEQEGVREVLVQVREDVPGDPRLVAYVVGGAEEGSWEEWRQYLRERLPEYMIPSAFVRLKELPLTANGKVNRQALPAPDKQRPELAAEYLAPVSQLEREIAGVWAEVLQVERVGREDNFFDLGGHSLLMLQVNSRLKELLGREVGMMELFQHPTVSAQAKYLSQTEAAPPSFQDSRARGQKQREVLIRQRELAKARA